ncbi:flagellar filament capping protein FliD [Caloramator proteoclasticus]|uniref:Flagellar hook-associated protein 2 n=1 Tax=Caloramator proteoclasticus DSM 10124 TaxID=1121262 RepID=A0A1M4SVG3_9CLOT|nr:flagellar filament capping protein FliD [Caloramator proteoclasticus]SHE36027.1 flagellar hook-associated protein 2 [Caloramator proteoclasticus DSM 10124]
MPSTLRITGLATGLDVDNMVKQLMQAERTKVDKVKQDRQIIQWRQDLYREIIGDLNTFKKTYFDVLSPEKYILSPNSLSPYSVNMSTSTSAVKVTATASARAGQYEIKDITLAQTAKVQSKEIPDISTEVSSSGSLSIRYNDSTPIEIEYGSDKTYKTYKDIITAINTKSNGQLKAYYSEITKKITIETAKTGSESTITINGANDLLGITDGTSDNGEDASFQIKTPGASDYTSVTKSNNTFTIDGLTFTLNESTTDTIKFSVGVNSKPAIDKIKEFVEKYNEIIDKINKKISEKRAYSYRPLTDEQRKEMKEDEIKKWEEKAKEGLLKGDSMLQDLVYNLRQAFFEPLKDSGISIQEIGLSTSSDYTQKGKIIIDESKLKAALENRPDDVLNLLTKTSSIAYDPNKTYTGRGDRNSEIGIFQRLKDILEDNIRTTRNSSGKKGALLEKAGLKGDFSEFNNILYKELQQKDRIIEDLNKKLFDKENKYYQQFAKLEKAMQKYNDQSAWLSSQLGAMFK